MSAYIQILGDRAKKCRRPAAKRKVASGRFRWVDQFTIEALPEPAAISNVRPFRFGPSAGFTDWAPRDSAGYLVMQLHTSRKLTA